MSKAAILLRILLSLALIVSAHNPGIALSIKPKQYGELCITLKGPVCPNCLVHILTELSQLRGILKTEFSCHSRLLGSKKILACIDFDQADISRQEIITIIRTNDFHIIAVK